MRFFVGLHQPSDAARLEPHAPAFISVNRLRGRKSPFAVGDWIMDSGAFTEIATHGHYRHDVADYAAVIRRWAGNGRLLAAVAQDYMCEPWIVSRTGLSVAAHQRLTVERYDALMACDTGDVYIMPVLQGYAPAEYVDHIRRYGDRLAPGAWVGVGSVCKRNGDPRAIEAVLLAIRDERPDLRLHGFGLKQTALGSGLVRQLLHTADSMAWSYAARREGRNPNDWREARSMVDRIKRQPVQWSLLVRSALAALALALPAAHAALPAAAPLAWTKPGADPYRGTVRQALASMYLPPEVASRLADRIERGDADGTVTIADDGVVADDGEVFAPHFDMTTGRAIASGSRSNLGPGRSERGALYRDGVYAVAVPTICANATRLYSAGWPHVEVAIPAVLPEAYLSPAPLLPPGGDWSGAWWPGIVPPAFAPAPHGGRGPVAGPGLIGPGGIPAPVPPGTVPHPLPGTPIDAPATALLLAAGLLAALAWRRA